MKFKGLIWMLLGSLSAIQGVTARGRGGGSKPKPKSKPANSAKKCSYRSLVEDPNGLFILQAECNKWSNLDLGQCYGSENGVLIPQDKGNFQDHCRNCVLDDMELSCECEVDDKAQPEDPNDESPKTRSDKTYKSTTINLDPTVGFDDYLLKCFDNEAKDGKTGESHEIYPIPLFSTISCILLLVYGLVHFGHRLK